MGQVYFIAVFGSFRFEAGDKGGGVVVTFGSDARALEPYTSFRSFDGASVEFFFHAVQGQLYGFIP